MGFVHSQMLQNAEYTVPACLHVCLYYIIFSLKVRAINSAGLSKWSQPVTLTETGKICSIFLVVTKQCRR